MFVLFKENFMVALWRIICYNVTRRKISVILLRSLCPLRRFSMLKYPCLVLDHDDTVIQSEAMLNYPCFCEFLDRIRPGEKITLQEYITACSRQPFAEMCRERYGYTEDELQEEYLLSAFENHGVSVGASISSIDDSDVAEFVVSEIDELSWAAINRKGSVVVIEVREKTPAPEKYDNSVPTNLIANENGLILSIDVLSGVEEIKSGSAVTKGDLLISGVVTYADGRERLVHGDGFVKAMWCGDEECEDKVKELTGVGSRCIPFNQEEISDKCICCGKPAKHLVYWGKAY
jgi:hypothetical protein